MSRSTGLAGLAINEQYCWENLEHLDYHTLYIVIPFSKFIPNMKMDKIAPRWEVKHAIIKLKLPVQ